MYVYVLVHRFDYSTEWHVESVFQFRKQADQRIAEQSADPSDAWRVIESYLTFQSPDE